MGPRWSAEGLHAQVRANHNPSQRSLERASSRRRATGVHHEKRRTRSSPIHRDPCRVKERRSRGARSCLVRIWSPDGKGLFPSPERVEGGRRSSIAERQLWNAAHRPRPATRRESGRAFGVARRPALLVRRQRDVRAQQKPVFVLNWTEELKSAYPTDASKPVACSPPPR